MNTAPTPPSLTHRQSTPAEHPTEHPGWAAAAVLTVCVLAISAAAIRVNLSAEPSMKRSASNTLGQEKNDAKEATAFIESAQSATK